MDAIKQAVVQTLEKQGIIAQLKAQLRAQVFLAVEEYDSASTGSGLASKTVVPARSPLISEADGQLAVQLVLDLFDTCNFAFTKRVFQPELGSRAPEGGRQTVAQTLGLKPSSPDEPLLVTLVKAFKAGPPARSSVNASSTPASAPTTASRPVDSSGPSKPVATAAAQAPPASAPASSGSSVPAPAGRAGASAAPLSRLEPLGKPTQSSLPQLGSAAGAKPADPPAPANKPQPEPSGQDGYDDDFEEVEDDVDAFATGDDDEDLAKALGCKNGTGAGSKDTADSGKERQDKSGAGPSISRGRTALDADLMAGDRSFGVSNELAGLDVGNSRDLSYSADFPGGMADTRASLSTSQAMLSPISENTPKLAKLEPLRPIGASKLSPLAPLAPLPSKSSSLTSSKDDPLGTKAPKALAPLGGPIRKSMVDIEKEKEELRRLGLLQSGDSLSNSIEVEARPRPMGAPNNIYDAEMSVSASMDDGTWAGGNSGGGAREEKWPAFGSKGISMDLGATGLSASDRSGDIEHMGVDLAETAEWH